MGPNEESHNLSSTPARIDSFESDDEEMARLRAEGWQIGFDVEMHAAVVEAAESEESESTTYDGQVCSSASDIENDDISTSNCGYVPLPSSVVDEEPSFNRAMALHCLPPNITPNNWILPSPSSTMDFERIQHQPIEIVLDQGKVEEIKRIMSRMVLSPRQQPEWVQHIDDIRLSGLVDQLKDGKVAENK